MRRARKLGLPRENLKPLKVFEAAKWQCHLCGIKTLAELRGSQDPRAPELDHIMPLTQGGGHTWDNVALACRACNMSKGARVRGQFLLFGVAPPR
jgi:5-methylcytosine-specific restriction endonuclease McrA